MEGIMALLVPILGVIFAVGFPLSIPIIVIVLRYQRRRRALELNHQERMAAIERGMEVPPLPLDIEPTPTRAPQTGLLRGLVCSFIGAALIVSWFLERESYLMTGGLIVAGVGIAYLVYYVVEGRKLVASASTPRAPQDQR